MTTVFEANHDGGPPVSNYYSFVSGSTDYQVNAAAALNGTPFGLYWPDITSGNTGSVAEQSMTIPAAEQRLRFRFSTSGLNMPVSVSSALGRIWRVQIRNNPGSNTAIAVQLRWNTDEQWLIRFSKTWNSDGDIVEFVLHEENIGTASAEYCVDCALTRASSAVANDGIVRLYVNGSLVYEDTAADYYNSASGLNQLDVQSPTSVANITGSGILDEILLTDDASTALCPPPGPATDAFTAAPMRKPASIDQDGSFIYIAALDSLGEPTLIKFSTNLASDGQAVFQPGSGTDIGVQCGRKDADIVWVAGAFGGTDTVEKSENAGSSFVVKDPGTFDPVVAFNISPESDEHILAATNLGSSAASGTLQLSLDDGVTWTEINSNTASIITDIAQLDINPQEVALGGENPDELDHSINYGQNLEDISGGGPTSNTTKVIVG